MTNALLIIFGFLELIIRFVLVLVIIATILGFILLVCMQEDDQLDVLWRPYLWKILEKNVSRK